MRNCENMQNTYIQGYWLKSVYLKWIGITIEEQGQEGVTYPMIILEQNFKINFSHYGQALDISATKYKIQIP